MASRWSIGQRLATRLMRIIVVIVAVLLFAVACGSNDSTLIWYGEETAESQLRVEVQADIDANGYLEECVEFMSMTPEKLALAIQGMVVFGVVPDTEMAARYIALAQDVCRDNKP